MAPKPVSQESRFRLRWIALAICCFGGLVWALYPQPIPNKPSLDREAWKACNPESHDSVKRVAIIGEYDPILRHTKLKQLTHQTDQVLDREVHRQLTISINSKIRASVSTSPYMKDLITSADAQPPLMLMMIPPNPWN